ncbi:MAG: hypothetical protein E6R07_07505 [Nevskiaceae bacterium]|nr:MAG: hypothetical protein E6R07_07505 [Nevskiaceae bacterium]
MILHRMLAGRVFLAIVISSATGKASASWFDFGWHDLGAALMAMPSATQYSNLGNSSASSQKDSQIEESAQTPRQKCREEDAVAESNEARPDHSMQRHPQPASDTPPDDEHKTGDDHQPQ